MPECPALLFDRIKGYPPGFRVFTNATTTPQRAALALGIDPALRPLDALKAWMEKRKTLDAAEAGRGRNAPRSWKTPCPGADVDLGASGADLAPQGRRAVHRLGLASSSCAIRTAAGSTPRSIACRCTARTSDDPVRPPGRHGAIIAKKYWDQGKTCPVAVVQRRGPGAVHRGLRISARRPLGIRLRRRDQRRADRGVRRPAHRPAAAGAGRDHPRRRLAADERSDAAGRPVRRIHRLLRRRRRGPAR